MAVLQDVQLGDSMNATSTTPRKASQHPNPPRLRADCRTRGKCLAAGGALREEVAASTPRHLEAVAEAARPDRRAGGIQSASAARAGSHPLWPDAAQSVQLPARLGGPDGARHRPRPPSTGVRVQACGDCHLLNFGTVRHPRAQPGLRHQRFRRDAGLRPGSGTSNAQNTSFAVAARDSNLPPTRRPGTPPLRARGLIEKHLARLFEAQSAGRLVRAPPRTSRP